MALIKCIECNQEISDTAKSCPHCGYKYKKQTPNIKSILSSFKEIFTINPEYSFFKKKIKLSSLKILSIATLICSFVLSVYPACFQLVRMNRLTFRTIKYNTSLFEVTINISVLLTILLILFALLGIINTIIYKNVKIPKLDKIHSKITLIPQIGYLLTTILTIIIVEFGSAEITSHYKSYYTTQWGGYFVAILATMSLIFLIIDLIKAKNKNRGLQ